MDAFMTLGKILAMEVEEGINDAFGRDNNQVASAKIFNY